MKKISVLIYLLILTACTTTPSVFNDYDKTHSFSNYKSFSWAQTPPLMVAGNLPVSEAIEVKATKALKDQLEAKGFTFVEDTDQANFLVAYTLGARDDVRVYDVDSNVYQNKENWLWGKKYHSYYFDMVVGEELRSSYTKGVIAIDVFDTKLKAPVWHGKASKSLDESEISSDGGNVAEAIQAVLSMFPPQY